MKKLLCILLALMVVLTTAVFVTAADDPTDQTVAEEPAEPATAEPTSPATVPATEASADPATEPATEAPADPATEPATEAPADPATEPATEAPADPATEPATEVSTEPATEPATEVPTEPPTEPPTEEPTEPPVIDPHITSIIPADKGIKISFTAYESAAKYRVFYKKSDGSGWKGIGDTTSLSFVRTGCTPYTSDIYTVRAIGANGKFCSDYDKQGYRYYYLPVPNLKKAEATEEGIRVTWNAVNGAPGYRFYVKTANGWKLLAEPKTYYYVDTTAQSGVKNTYTVKVYDTEKQEALSYFDRTGISATYIATPQIISCTPVQGGMKVSWNAVGGAVKYRLFYKTETAWKTIGNTTSTSFVHTNPVMGQEYIYTVRVTDANGKYISGYDKAGFAATCLANPTLRKAESVNGGVKVSWDPVEGAAAYRVYVKNGSGWKGLGNTAETSWLDETALSGGTYTYTVRAIDPETGEMRSYFDRAGISTRYIATPQIISFTPVEGGTKVTWSAVDGAVKYRLFYKTETAWKTIGNTTAATFTHTNPEQGQKYIYTVRVTDASGKYISSYNAAGWAYRYIAPPAIASVTKADEGTVVEWEPVEGAAGYRLYRKSFGASWKALVNTAETSYADVDAPADTLYTYTLRTLDDEGRLNSFHLKDTPYYYNGELADGSIPYNGATIRFVSGYVRQGYVTVDGKTYYYDSTGTLKKNGIVGTAAEGYRYADQNGVIDNTARLAVTSGGYDWNVLDGKATKVSTEKDRTMFRALKLMNKLTSTTDTKAQKLKKCFNYLQTETYEYNPRVPHYRGMDWPIVYANDIFTTNGGNCLSYAAAFAFMAKAIGYDDVYACHSGGHGWTEIGGLIYDSEWQRSNHKYSYYGLSYYTETDVDYLAVKQNFPYSAWMHIEI